MTDSAVVVEDLVKVYPKVRAVDKISFSVNNGEIFGLLGPNGAGVRGIFQAIEAG